MQALGLDVGSSSIKGAVLDLGTRAVVHVIERPFPAPTPDSPPGHFEVDPEAVVDVCRDVLDGLVGRSDAASAFFSTQMGGLLLVDPVSRRALSPYLSWRDQRAAETHPGMAVSVHEALIRALGDEHRLRVGNEVTIGSALSLLYWMTVHCRLPARFTPLGIGEYLVMRLANAEPCTHVTNTGSLLDVRRGDFSDATLACAGIAPPVWPRLADLGAPVGRYAHRIRGIDCYPAVADHPCALAGAALEERELSINISTGSQVSLLTLSPQLALTCQTRPYFDGQYLNTVTHLPAGRSLNMLVDLVCELPRAAGAPMDDPWPLILKLAEAAPPGDLEVGLSFFKGPTGSRGFVGNVGLDNLSVGRLFRQAFASMADNYALASEWLADRSAWDRIVLSGGLARKAALLRDLIEARFQVPCRFSDRADETLGGLLALADTACKR